MGYRVTEINRERIIAMFLLKRSSSFSNFANGFFPADFFPIPTTASNRLAHVLAGRGAGPGRGLAPMDAPPGTFFAYATAPGNVASDGEGANGLYTEHLLREIKVPERILNEVKGFSRVCLDISSKPPATIERELAVRSATARREVRILVAQHERAWLAGGTQLIEFRRPRVAAALRGREHDQRPFERQAGERERAVVVGRERAHRRLQAPARIAGRAHRRPVLAADGVAVGRRETDAPKTSR